MVKIIDQYILERVIGNGQYGKVYKGYNKLNGEDVAVKVIARKKLKGKFTELLNNEIKVLKSCKNNNIVRLIDLKKTSNNIYIILEYCNEGDLQEYLKKKGRLSEDEATDIFIQIINAFKTLNKNKIMHRDLKLANILKHNGIIKIADFGFSKLLGEKDLAKTILGSPLNMAPEILEEKNYNNKADIWSIGICFYEMIYGVVPYTGKNIMDLIKNIKTKNVSFKSEIKLNEIIKDIIRRMLIYDSEKRIDYKDLFNHKVNFLLENKIKDNMETTLNKEENIMNISKFYFNNNKVIYHLSEIKKKSEINTYIFDMMKNNQGKKFNGKLLNFDDKRTIRNIKIEDNINKIIDEKEQNEKITKELTLREKKIKNFKNNTSKILHERNIYIFLSNLGIDCLNFNFEYSNILNFLIFKKLFIMVNNLKDIMEYKINKMNLELWKEYIETEEFKELNYFILNEYHFYKSFLSYLKNYVANKIQDLNDELIKNCLYAKESKEIEDQLCIIIKKYLKNILKENDIKDKKVLIHLFYIWEILDLDNKFKYYSEKDNKYFDFNLYYSHFETLDIDELNKMVIQNYEKIIE